METSSPMSCMNNLDGIDRFVLKEAGMNLGTGDKKDATRNVRYVAKCEFTSNFLDSAA